MNCPMCGEPWNRDRCSSCGWSERLDPVNRERLDAITGSFLDVREGEEVLVLQVENVWVEKAK